MKINKKKLIGIALLAIAIYLLYNWFVGERNASRDWWCKIPVFGTILCTVPVETTLITAIVLGVAGVYLVAK
jgi:type II secretory pathway component PulF